VTTINQIKNYRIWEDWGARERARRSFEISHQEEKEAVAKPYFRKGYNHSTSTSPPSPLSDSLSSQITGWVTDTALQCRRYSKSCTLSSWGRLHSPTRTQDMHIHLANSADFSSVPATVCATVAHKRGVTAEHDVQNHSQAPKITSLIVERGLLREDFNHFWCHVFCRSTLGNHIQASFQREDQIKT